MSDHTRTPGDAERRAMIKTRGLEALGRIKNYSTYEDWRTVGEALLVITEETLAALNLPADGWDKDNKKLVKEFNRRWDAWEQSPGDNQDPLSSGSRQERWALREIMTNPIYHAYYTSLTGPERRRLNHPNAIINKYKAKHRLKPNNEYLSEREKLKDQIAQKDAHIADLESARDDGDRFKVTDTAQQIADTLVRMFKPGKAKEIATRMLALLKNREAA